MKFGRLWTKINFTPTKKVHILKNRFMCVILNQDFSPHSTELPNSNPFSETGITYAHYAVIFVITI